MRNDQNSRVFFIAKEAGEEKKKKKMKIEDGKNIEKFLATHFRLFENI